MAAAGSGRGEVRPALSAHGLNVYRARPTADRTRLGRDVTLSPELDALADRVRRLLPSHRDPEAFHVERDAIERALRRSARQGR